jgi:hypothetical protein
METKNELGGRELDAAIARGLGVDKHPDWWWWKTTMPSWPDDVPAMYCGPEFHRSLDATMQHCGQYEWVLCTVADSSFVAEAWPKGRWGKQGSAQADTAALALALAIRASQETDSE